MTPSEWEMESEKLDAAIEAIVKSNPDKTQQIKSRPALIGWFVGKAMKATGGILPPEMVMESVKHHLGIY